MDTGRGNGNRNIACLGCCPVNKTAALYGTDCEPGNIVSANGVYPWHLRCFTAHKGTSCETASFSDACDDLRCLFHVQLAGCEIIQEE